MEKQTDFRIRSYEVSGDDPFIAPSFDRSYLIEVREK